MKKFFIVPSLFSEMSKYDIKPSKLCPFFITSSFVSWHDMLNIFIYECEQTKSSFKLFLLPCFDGLTWSFHPKKWVFFVCVISTVADSFISSSSILLFLCVWWKTEEKMLFGAANMNFFWVLNMFSLLIVIIVLVFMGQTVKVNENCS